MEIKIEKRNIFELDESYLFVQPISADFKCKNDYDN